MNPYELYLISGSKQLKQFYVYIYICHMAIPEQPFYEFLFWKALVCVLNSCFITPVLTISAAVVGCCSYFPFILGYSSTFFCMPC